MDFIVDLLLAAVLFVLLSPGILVRLPQNGSKWTVAIVHGIIFAIAMYVSYEFVLPNLEGYKEGAKQIGNRLNAGNQNFMRRHSTIISR